MKKLGFLKPLLNFYLVGLIITTLSRILLVLFFHDRVFEIGNIALLFLIGLRLDIIMLSYISLLPAALIILLPDSFLMKIKTFIRYYFLFFLFLFLFMEVATPNFILQYDTRPNRLFIDYLIYPREVFEMLIKGFWLQILLAMVVLVVAIYFLLKKTKYTFQIVPSAYLVKLISFPFVVFFIFFGIRSSLTAPRPINPSNAVFCYDQLTNSLAVNSLYSLIYAAYSIQYEEDASKKYGKMDEDEAYNRVKKYMTAKESDFIDPEFPLLHRLKPDVESTQQYNVVIFLQESLGAEYVGCLGGMPLTPEFDKLSKEGLLFTNLYCTGTRSVRGIEAVVSGFLPSSSQSVVKLSNSQTGFFTLASLLKKEGYQTSFVYGGMSNFDDMASFFNGNGFDNIVDENDFRPSEIAFKGTWGVSDEDLVIKASELYKSYRNKPFFSLIFSSSNHEPFEFPDGRISLYEQPKNTVHNAIKYADFAIGKLIELAKKEDYYKNTIFLIIADHNTRTKGKHLIPVHKFRIPALMIGPTVAQGKTYDKLCSQIDIPVSLIDRLGKEFFIPMPGRNLFQLPDDAKGRCLMQFNDINGFRVDNQLIITQPDVAPLQFELINDTTLLPVDLDKELAKDALAHLVTATNLYKKRRYTLKK